MDHRDRGCVYCGATEAQLGERLVLDHFYPQSKGGKGGANLVLACRMCNYVKRDRVFESIEAAARFIHVKLWTNRSRRRARYRPIAFGGKPPTGITRAEFLASKNRQRPTRGDRRSDRRTADSPTIANTPESAAPLSADLSTEPPI